MQTYIFMLCVSGGQAGYDVLELNASAAQMRVWQSCAAGTSMRGIAENGSVVCDVDMDSGGDITAVLAGRGLLGGAVGGDATLTVNSSAVQMKLTKRTPM